MRWPQFLSFAVAALCATFAMAQQGVLTNGNSQLPSCAQSCQLLQQAAQACSGTATADQAVWICFCQSAYLKDLYTTDEGICSSVCTDASDSQQVSTWYKSNCGTDNGASEHSGTAPTTTSAPTTTTSASLPDSSIVSNSRSGSTWWGSHWQWIVMLLVLAIGLTAVAFGLIWFKRWRRRRQDRINGGFNSGITTRHAPTSKPGGPNATQINASSTSADHSGIAEPMPYKNAANNSARTREAFMPYGYGYTRSESRIGHQADRSSVLSGRGTPALSEKDVAVPETSIHGTDSPHGKRLASRPLSERNLQGYNPHVPQDTRDVTREK